jgi:hypothetical protein
MIATVTAFGPTKPAAAFSQRPVLASQVTIANVVDIRPAKYPVGISITAITSVTSAIIPRDVVSGKADGLTQRHRIGAIANTPTANMEPGSLFVGLLLLTLSR